MTGDAYAGQTFRRDFEDLGIAYTVSNWSKSQIYDAFEPKLNAGEVALLDHPKLTEQLLTLVLRGGKIDHLPGDHDDFANAAAGAIWLAADRGQVIPITSPIVVMTPRSGIGDGNYFGGDVSMPPGGWPAGRAPPAAPFWKP